MKKILFVLIVLGFSANAIAQTTTQQDTLPTAIRDQIAAKFGDASAMEWTIADSIYTGTFTSNGERHMIEYTDSGRMISHNYRLKKEEYPVAITAVLQRDYSKHKIDDIDYVERDGAVTYEVDLDGKPDYKLVFDSSGKILSSKSR